MGIHFRISVLIFKIGPLASSEFLKFRREMDTKTDIRWAARLALRNFALHRRRAAV